MYVGAKKSLDIQHPLFYSSGMLLALECAVPSHKEIYLVLSWPPSKRPNLICRELWNETKPKSIRKESLLVEIKTVNLKFKGEREEAGMHGVERMCW